MPENYVLLRKITLTSTTASITFSGIPSSGYTDLKFVTSARSDAATLATGGLVAFNGITANFSTRYMYGTGSSVVQATGGREFGSMPGASATANTFSSSEAIIPNYLLSNVKGYSVNTVTETNGAEIYAYLFAGVWADTAAINSITYSPASGSFVAGSSFCLYGLAAVGTTPAIAPFATGGDTVTTDGTYWIHTFLSSGTFTPAKNLTCDYLVVAGAGAGGGHVGGGGGAGGLRSTVTASGGSPGTAETPALSVTAQNYAVIVGAGGSAGTNTRGSNGSNSIFSTITSLGGGGGGTNQNSLFNGLTGGSGGGAGGTGAQGNGTGGSGTANQGFAGGNQSLNLSGAAGGGGAGVAGVSGSNTNISGNGGDGRQVAITGSSVFYAGGGGAGGYGNPVPSGTGGAGGGASGSTTPDVNGVAGTANTGGGGSGGTSYFAGNKNGGNGGSGIVIIRYPIA
jgi:hypothetical protein